MVNCHKGKIIGGVRFLYPDDYFFELVMQLSHLPDIIAIPEVNIPHFVIIYFATY